MTDAVHHDPDDIAEESPEGTLSDEASPEAAPTGGPAEELSVEDIALLRTDEIRTALAKAGERDVYADRLLRLQAEFDNFRRREARDRENWRRHSIRGLVLDILEVVDNFERALDADPGAEGHTEFVKGIELVEKQLTGVLEQAGLRPIEARGEPFDPALHEAVATAPSEGAANDTVLEEIRRGYTMDEVVLRPTRVCVVRNPGDRARGEESPDEASRDGDD